MSFLNAHWMRYRAILFSVMLLSCLNATDVNDFDEIYSIQRNECKNNPSNYLQNGTSFMKCNISFAAACWPETLAGSTFIQPCPILFFLPGGFIHRHCNASGQWEKMNITQCQKLNKTQALEIRKKMLCELAKKECLPSKSDSTDELIQRYINEDKLFMAFSWVSVSIMLPSLLLLICMKDTSESDRFSLHKNLLVAFLMSTFTYIAEYYGNLSFQDNLLKVCNGVWIMNRYFAVAEVTWMMNEAIFFLRLLIRAFDYNSYFWRYFCFGWGLPALLTFIIYVPTSVVVYGLNDPSCWSVHGQEVIMMILYGPMTLMLMINLGIMVYALYTLVRKMKVTNTPEGQIFRKTTKGTLILIPQMGVIYLLIFYVPRGNVEFNYFVRVIFPLQGALAALVFVAFNSEVREAVLLRWYQWQYNNHTEKELSSSEKRGNRDMSGELPMSSQDFLSRTRDDEDVTSQTISSSLSTVAPNTALNQEPSQGSLPRMQPGMIEMKEIRRQEIPSCQRKDSESVLHSKPCCGHHSSNSANFVSPVASPKHVTKHVITSLNSKQTKQTVRKNSTQFLGPRERSSTGTFRRTHDMDSYIRSRSINDQVQPRMLESSDSGIGDLQAEKRLSFQSEMTFEEVIHLENALSTRPPPLARRMFIARKSCPLIGQTDELIGLRENLPKNIREAFRGYGVCNEPKKLKKPQKQQSSATIYCNINYGTCGSTRPESHRIKAEKMTSQ